MIVPSADLTLLRRPDPAPERGRTVRSFCLSVVACRSWPCRPCCRCTRCGGRCWPPAAATSPPRTRGRISRGGTARRRTTCSGTAACTPPTTALISPYVMAAVGVRALTVASGLAATWVAAVLVARALPRRPVAPALLAALGLWGNVASGRTTFALGSPSGSPRVCTSPVRASPGRNVSSSPAPTPPSPPWRPRSRGCSSRSSGRVVCWRGGRVPRSPCCCRPRWWSGRPVSSSPSTGSS